MSRKDDSESVAKRKKDTLPVKVQTDVTLYLSDGTKVRMTAEEYKKKGKRVWDVSLKT